MATMERDIINQGRDENGNLTIDYPLTRLGWMESSADVKSAPGANDFIPIVDSADNEKMKKTPAAALNALAAPMRYDYSGAGNVTDFLAADINNPNGDLNLSRMFAGKRNSFINVPPGLGVADNDDIIGLREVLFLGTGRVMLKITEVYPNAGRVYFTHFNQTYWTGWYCPDLSLSDVSKRVSVLPQQNMLDNWYFAAPINQRGLSTYENDWYGIDRWSKDSYQGGFTVTVMEDCVRLTSTKQGVSIYTQVLPTELRNQLEGKTVTASVLTKNGLAAVTAIMADGVSANSTQAVDGGACLNLTYSKAANFMAMRLMFLPEAAVGSAVDLVAAKLELGDRQTLAHQDANGNWVLNDPPPDRTLELIKCQQYYQRHGCGLTCAVHSDTMVLFTFPFSVKMRAAPTVKLLTETLPLHHSTQSKDLAFSGASITQNVVDEKGVGALIIQGTFPGGTSSTEGDVLRLNGIVDLFEFSAEL